MAIQDAIRSYMNANGIKQSYVASKSGINPTSLCLILNGKRRLLVEEYMEICSSLGVSDDYFIRLVQVDKASKECESKTAEQKL